MVSVLYSNDASMNVFFYNFWHKLNTAKWGLICTLVSIVAYITLTLPGYFQPNHLLYNLEPYPDGILYSLAARNWIKNGELGLQYRDSFLNYWVQPLYAFVLSIGYLVNYSVSTFYLVNIILGCSTLAVVLLTVKHTTHNTGSLAFASATFFFHAYTLWLPTVPMAENLSLFLFSVAIWGLVTNDTFSWKKSILVFLCVLGLAATKSASIILALGMMLIALQQVIRQLPKIAVGVLAGAAVIALIIYSLFVQNLFVLLLRHFASLVSEDSQYIALKFFGPNISQYWNALVSETGKFLWFVTPLSSILIFLLFLGAPLIFKITKNKTSQTKSLMLVTLFLFQLPLMLVFYTVDARYIIYSIPLFAIQIAWLVNEIFQTKKLFFLIPICFSLLMLLIQQKALFQEIIASNILGKSTAWQYVAIKHFDSALKDSEDALIVTALPPFLFDAYSEADYRVLPLSTSQEFIQKGEYVWGSDVSYQNLDAGYKKLLQEGNVLYISNAYITHQQSVIQDYEKFKNLFNAELVSEGCLSACNIYKLTLKASE